MAERKQKLIHLHSAEALSVAKANAVNMAVGEIAVQAADKTDSSLWILTSDGKQVVQFPSVDKVTSLITGATSDNISTLQNKVKELEGTVSGYSFYFTERLHLQKSLKKTLPIRCYCRLAHCQMFLGKVWMRCSAEPERHSSSACSN